MNIDDLLESLLNEDESSTLDFKSKQYKFREADRNPVRQQNNGSLWIRHIHPREDIPAPIAQGRAGRLLQQIPANPPAIRLFAGRYQASVEWRRPA